MSELALIEFDYPYIALAFILFIICHFKCPIRTRSIYFANVRHFQEHNSAKSYLLVLFKFLTLITLLLAMMAPHTSKRLDVTPKQGFDIAMVMDASESMYQRGFNELDPRQTRFDVVQTMVSDFVRKRTNDNLGLVVFGDTAFIAAPLTYDKVILSDIVQRMQIGIAGRSTAIFDAIGQSENILAKSEAKSKIIILLTDGMDNRSKLTLDMVLSIAKKEKMKIYTIGIGYGREFNPALLQTIAEQTDGRFFSAHNASELKAVYEEIDTLERSEIKSKHFVQKEYYYKTLLVIALLSTLGYVWLRNARELA